MTKTVREPKTPGEALAVYRRLSPSEMKAWVAEILAMSHEERIELLCWMVLHLSGATMSMAIDTGHGDEGLMNIDDALRVVEPEKSN